MSYDPPNFEGIRSELLDVLRNQVPGAKVAEGSENYARASLAAGATALLCYGVKYVERQIFPDSADHDNLLRHGALYGLQPKEATAASGGTVTLTGTNGTVVPSGLAGVHDDGTEFETTAGGTIAGGVLVVAAVATTTGSAGNKVAGDEITLQAPPLGVDGTATVATDFKGGTDDEKDADFLERVLQRMRAGNAGGTADDYEQWALSIAGVVAADCLPTRRGPGTVSVAVYTEGPGGYRSPADGTLRTTVAAYLATVKPVSAEVDVPAVTEVSLDVEIHVIEYDPGYLESAVRADVETAVKASIYSRTTGETAYWVELNRTVASVAGVRDYEIVAPTGNTACTVDSSTVEVLIPGTVTVT